MHKSWFSLRTHVSQHGVITFFFLAFFIAWLFWIPMALYQVGAWSFQIPLLLGQSIGAYAPLIAVLIVRKLTQQGPTIEQIAATIRVNQPARPWLLVAAVIPPLIVLVANSIYYLVDPGTTTIINAEVYAEAGWFFVLLIPVHFVTAFLSSPLGEEPGWRGYALPQLQAHFHPLVASAILGLLWGIWHGPLLIAAGSSISSAFLIGIVGHSLLIDKLYSRAHNNLLVALVYHQAISTTGVFLAGGIETPLALLLTWIMVIVVRNDDIVMVVTQARARIPRKTM